MLKNPVYKYGNSSVSIPASINLGEFLLNRVSEAPNKDAVINAETNKIIKYGQIAQQAANLAVSLYNLGVRKGQTVAFCSENRSECCATIIGALCTGATITAVNLAYTKGELKHVLTISKPSYIFCSPITYKMHGKTFLSLPYVKKVIVYNATETNNNVISYEQLVKNNVNRDDLQVIDVEGQNDVAVILYSSGTTGLPKGVLLTHLNVVALCCQPTINATSNESKILTISPWFHALGLIGLLLNLTHVRTIVHLPKFDVDLFLTCIDKYKVTSCTVVPPVLVAITKTKKKYDLSSVLMIFCGAAPLSQEVIDGAKKVFPNLIAVLQAYGMTETTLGVTRDLGEHPEKSKKGTVGIVTNGMTIKIIDIDSGKPVGVNKPGEICVKGVTIMKGYIGRDRKEDFDDEGFFKTGDIGYYDEDGYFYIVDRLKELIKYKAYQVPPAEIEAVLLSHPSIKDAGVIGIPRGDVGEIPMAFVVMQPGERGDEEEIKKFVAERLSNPKHLRGGVRFVDDIPKNPSGKILRRDLRKMVKDSKSKL